MSQPAERIGPAQGLHIRYPEDKYFADPCSLPSLSQSIACTLIQKSEKHAWLEHPRLGGVPRIPTRAMDVGTICHALMLGKPLPEIEVIDVGDYKTKAAKELRNAAIAAGRIPLKTKEWEGHSSIQAAAERLRDKIRSNRIEFDPESSEVAFFWRQNGVQCRARLDNLQGFHVFDLKFGESANPSMIDRTIFQKGYHIQHAAYTEAVRECLPDARGRERFTLIFCEVVEPFCVQLVEFSESAKQLGRMQWRRAQETWLRCLETNTWNEYSRPGMCHVVDAKPWDLERELEYGTAASF